MRSDFFSTTTRDIQIPNKRPIIHDNATNNDIIYIYTRFYLHEYGDEQAYAGRDGRTRLGRPNSQARTGTGKCSRFSLFSADQEQD